MANETNEKTVKPADVKYMSLYVSFFSVISIWYNLESLIQEKITPLFLTLEKTQMFSWQMAEQPTHVGYNLKSQSFQNIMKELVFLGTLTGLMVFQTKNQ